MVYYCLYSLFHFDTCDIYLQATELVYVYLNSSDKHELLLGSSHFTPFMHYLISKKLMKSLVTKTLQLNRSVYHNILALCDIVHPSLVLETKP